jgi:hypothetical protein
LTSIETTREPAGSFASTSIFSPDTCGKRPARFGSCDTPFSSAARRSAPVSATITVVLPKGISERMSRRVSFVPGG